MAVPPIGILRSLTAITRLPFGGVLENQTAIELAKLSESLSGWKSAPGGGEIDFIVRTRGRTVPVECKASLAVNARHTKGIAGYLKTFGEKTGVVVCFARYAMERLAEGRRIVVLPAYLLERFIEATNIE